MGADPVGTAIMRAAGDQDRAIDAFVVRKAQKSYGIPSGGGTALRVAAWLLLRTPPRPVVLR